MISIIIPAYNEEKRLAKSLPIILKQMINIGDSFEIIVADDGSSDKTRDIASQYGCKLTPSRENKGKWFSIREGIMLSQGDYILMTDADLSVPINYLNDFMKIIQKYDIVIASRALKESQVKTSLFKKIAGRISNIPISLLIKDIKDTQTGFKLFESKKAKQIFSKCFIDRWCGDVEVLYLYQKYGYKIKEVGVKWTNMPGSKVKLSDYPKTLLELFKIYIHDYE